MVYWNDRKTKQITELLMEYTGPNVNWIKSFPVWTVWGVVWAQPCCEPVPLYSNFGNLFLTPFPFSNHGVIWGPPQQPIIVTPSCWPCGLPHAIGWTCYTDALEESAHSHWIKDALFIHETGKNEAYSRRLWSHIFKNLWKSHRFWTMLCLWHSMWPHEFSSPYL